MIYYLDFTSIYVFDEVQTHISASVSMSIEVSRKILEQTVLEADIYTSLMNSVGMAGDVPEPKMLLADLRGFNIFVARKIVNGDVDLALKRYAATMRK